MKKTALSSLCLALCVLLCACGSDKTALKTEDLSMTVDGKTVSADASVASILERFGPDYEMAEAVSCVYSGMERTYSYEHFILYTYPGDDGQEHLMEAYADAGAQTSRGVKVGDSLKDVEAAYGSDYTRAGGVVTFSMEGANEQTVPAGIYFELSDDIVTAIGIVAEHRAQ